MVSYGGTRNLTEHVLERNHWKMIRMATVGRQVSRLIRMVNSVLYGGNSGRKFSGIIKSSTKTLEQLIIIYM